MCARGRRWSRRRLFAPRGSALVQESAEEVGVDAGAEGAGEDGEGHRVECRGGFFGFEELWLRGIDGEAAGRGGGVCEAAFGVEDGDVFAGFGRRLQRSGQRIAGACGHELLVEKS